jgi:hypothetical protein
MTATTVRFGRLERRGLLLGLRAWQLALLGVAVVLAVAAEYTAGGQGLLLTSPAWAGLAGLALVQVGERPLGSWVPLITDWRVRGLLRRTTHRAVPLKADHWLVTLPAVGSLDVRADVDGRAVLVDHGRGTAVAAVVVRPTGALLMDEDAQQQAVSDWSRVLAGLCRQSGITRAQVMVGHRTDGSDATAQWWSEHALHDTPWAEQVVGDLLADAATIGTRPVVIVAAAWRVPRMRSRDASALLAPASGLVDALSQAGLEPSTWLDTDAWASIVRDAYDDRPGRHEVPSHGIGLVGPMGVDEQWDHVRTDSAFHAVFWVREWPRLDVPATFLQPMLTPTGRRMLSLIVEPLPAARALRDVRRALVEHAADDAQRVRAGRIEDEARRAEHEDVRQRERELVAGHGDLRFAGLVVVSAASLDALERACAETETAAAQSMLELRRLVGQQAQAHASASLPLARALW